MSDNSFSNLVKQSVIKDQEIRDRNSGSYAKHDSKNKTSLFDTIKDGNFDEIRKKLKKNFFAGFGFGLIVAALCMFFFQPMSRRDKQMIEDKKVADMKNAEIVDKATKLGMVFPENAKKMENNEENKNK